MHLKVRCSAHSRMEERISNSASQRRTCKSRSVKRSWTHSWSTLCYIPFLVQFPGEPLTQAISTAHQSPCLPYGEATVLREVVQYFSTASQRAGHVYTVNVKIAVIYFPHSFISLMMGPGYEALGRTAMSPASSLHRLRFELCFSLEE